MRNESMNASFYYAVSTILLCLFCEKQEAVVWNQGIFRILIYDLLTAYVEIILEATISRVFPTHM